MRRTIVILIAMLGSCVMAPSPALVKACAEGCADSGGMDKVTGSACPGNANSNGYCHCKDESQ